MLVELSKYMAIGIEIPAVKIKIATIRPKIKYLFLKSKRLRYFVADLGNAATFKSKLFVEFLRPPPFTESIAFSINEF